MFSRITWCRLCAGRLRSNRRSGRFFAAKVVTAHLKQDEGQQQAAVSAMVAVPAADRVAEHGKVLQVAKVEARKPEFRRVATRTNHNSTIRLLPRKIHSPTEGLLPEAGFRCTVSIGSIQEE